MSFPAGVDAAKDICEKCMLPGFVYPEDPLTDEFAGGALQEMSDFLLRMKNGIVEKMAAGAMDAAKQLCTLRAHGVYEVIQNADDLGSSEVNFLLEENERGRLLHMRHQGRPVLISNILGMALAFISTKTDDAAATGRFGIGLKTLWRLGKILEVHCGPYSFSICNREIEKVTPIDSLHGSFFQRGRGDTLLSLTLDDDVDCKSLMKELEKETSSLLVFLRSVKRVNFAYGDSLHEISLDLIKVEHNITPNITRTVLAGGEEENHCLPPHGTGS